MKNRKFTEKEIQENLNALIHTACFYLSDENKCKEALKSIRDYLVFYGCDTVEHKPSVVSMDYLSYLIRMKIAILNNRFVDIVNILFSLERRYNILKEPVKSGILLLLNDL